MNIAPPKVRDWSFLVVHVAGHGIEGDIADNLRSLDQAGTSPDAYITVRAEQADQVTDFSLTEKSAGPPGGHLRPWKGGYFKVSNRTHPIVDGGELKDFLTQAARAFPARHYYVSFDGHSRQLRQVIPQLHEGLQAMTQATGKKVDVLAFDSCFMGQLETASEFKDVAQTLVASEDSVNGSSPVGLLAQKVSEQPMAAADVARAVVASRVGKEQTAAAFDLGKADQVNQAVAGLSEAIRAIPDQTALEHIRNDVGAAQHFYTLGIAKPNPYHATVDVADAMDHLHRDAYLQRVVPSLVEKADGVSQALDRSGFILAEQHSDKVKRTPTLDYLDDRRAHGVSLHWPTTAPSRERSEYTHFHNSQFERETHWDEAMNALTSGPEGYRVSSHLRDLEGASLWALSLGMDDISEHWKKLRHPPQPFYPPSV